jgi:hypothetical protein
MLQHLLHRRFPVPWEEFLRIPPPRLNHVGPAHRCPPWHHYGTQLVLHQLAEQPQEALAFTAGSRTHSWMGSRSPRGGWEDVRRHTLFFSSTA